MSKQVQQWVSASVKGLKCCVEENNLQGYSVAHLHLRERLIDHGVPMQARQLSKMLGTVG